MKSLYKFRYPSSGGPTIEGLFIADSLAINTLVSLEIPLPLGVIRDEHITWVSSDTLAIDVVERLGLEHGANPLQCRTPEGKLVYTLVAEKLMELASSLSKTPLMSQSDLVATIKGEENP